MNEIIREGISVTVIGMGIVFGVLILLWGILELMKVIFNPSSKKELPSKKAIETPAQPIIEDSAIDDDDELIAVITAAIAATLKTQASKLKIASIRRTENNSPVWNNAGRQEILNKSL